MSGFCQFCEVSGSSCQAQALVIPKLLLCMLIEQFSYGFKHVLITATAIHRGGRSSSSSPSLLPSLVSRLHLRVLFNLRFALGRTNKNTIHKNKFSKAAMPRPFACGATARGCSWRRRHRGRGKEKVRHAPVHELTSTPRPSSECLAWRTALRSLRPASSSCARIGTIAFLPLPWSGLRAFRDTSCRTPRAKRPTE